MQTLNDETKISPLRFAWKLYDDGSFDLLSRDEQQQESIALLAGYPSKDSLPLRPISVRVVRNDEEKAGHITYIASGFTLRLNFAVQEASRATLDSVITCHASQTPHVVSPLSMARITGANDVFTVEDGYVKMGDRNEARSEKVAASSVLAAFVADDAVTLVVSPTDYRRFACRFTMETMRPAAFSVGFALEEIKAAAHEAISLPTLYFSLETRRKRRCDKRHKKRRRKWQPARCVMLCR